MIEEGDRGNLATKTTNDSVSRRNVLLGGTTLAAASAIASTGSVQTAQAQQRPTPAQSAPSGRKPNILFIMGDDIGWFNVSASATC